MTHFLFYSKSEAIELLKYYYCRFEMEINLKRKQEFMAFFQKLQEQKNTFYTKEQIIKLKTYEIHLFDCFLWKQRDLYLNLFISFLNSNISGDEFSEQLICMRANHIAEFRELINQLELMSQSEINFEFLNKFNLDLNAFGFTGIIDLVFYDLIETFKFN